MLASARLLSAADANLIANGGELIFAFETPVINLMTAPGTWTDVDMPLVAGKRFWLRAPVRIDAITRDAALTTGLTYELGQNGAAINAAASITTGTFNALAAPATYPSTTGIVAFDVSAFPAQFRVTIPVAGAGLTTCTGRMVLVGSYL